LASDLQQPSQEELFAASQQSASPRSGDSERYARPRSGDSERYARPRGGDSERYKLFVGGLAWTTTETTLAQKFGQFGELVEVRVIMEHEDPTRSRGFAFVSFRDEAPMNAAISAMDQVEVDGRAITVNQAEARGARRGDSRGDRDGAGYGNGSRAGTGHDDGGTRRPGRGGGSASGERREAKYDAAARNNMTRTVAEDQADDDEARMKAYLARKAARDKARG
jgi:RNA recognition motif-containing protein